MTSQLDTLTQINLDDLVNAFGWQKRPLLASMLRRLFIKPAHRFAQQILDFDSIIARRGLVEASRLTQQYYVRDIRVFNSDRVPASGFLALSNHPGMTDTLSLFCVLQRNDLKIIALNRPFLKSLPNLSKHLFFVTDDPYERVTLVRHVSRHLRAGGAALTFPAGHTEPDPDTYSGAVESLQSWLDSVGVFIRLAPEMAVLPIVVRSVIWDKIAHHPIIRTKRTKDERELLAVAFQLLAHVMFNIKPVIVKVQIGKPITAHELGTTDTQIIRHAVAAEMKQLFENPPEGEGISAL